MLSENTKTSLWTLHTGNYWNVT